MSKTIVLVAALAACGPSSQRTGGDASGNHDGTGSSDGSGSGSQDGCAGLSNCYSVYAHSNDTLYVVDLQAKTLQTIGKFNSGSDNITDLAVAPDNTIYVVSETALYTASGSTGQVTKVGSLSTCGSKIVALTTLANGQIWTGDSAGGKLCQIDISTNPPTVKPPITMSGGLALSGDLVALGDGSVFGSAYKISDGSGGTFNNNLLVRIDMTNGNTTQLGSTGYPKLFGVSFAQNQVIGFTHDGTGHVVSINPTNGTSTLFATFKDPTTNMPISFAGAGVNSLVVLQ